MLAISDVFFRSVVLFLILTGTQLEGSVFFRNTESRNRREAKDAAIDQPQSQVSSGAGFDYSQPKKWGINSPSCWGTRQSPIDLKPSKMVRLTVRSPLRRKGYDILPKNMTIKNNGHSVAVTSSWNDDQIPSISGGVLEGEYLFAQFHFHWGSHDEVGSEHTINGHRFPLELHLVHYKKEYGSFSNATKQDDGLVVIGVLYKISRWHNLGIAELQKKENEIRVPGSEKEINPFSLSDLNVNLRDEYLAYLGSLTTPPCSETVTWILPVTSNYVSSEQMHFFRSIQLLHDDNHNYRPTMPMNGRTINYISNHRKSRRTFMVDS